MTKDELTSGEQDELLFDTRLLGEKTRMQLHSGAGGGEKDDRNKQKIGTFPQNDLGFFVFFLRRNGKIFRSPQILDEVVF